MDCHMGDLPNELILTLLAQLQIKDVIACSTTITHWHHLMDNPFWKLLFDRDYGKQLGEPSNLIQWHDVYKKYHLDSDGLDFYEKMRWGIKNKCSSFVIRLIVNNRTFPLWMSTSDQSSYMYLAAVRGLTAGVECLLTHGRTHPDETLARNP